MPKKREIPKETVGARLRAARKGKHYTLTQVGRKLGVSPQAVAQWEYGDAEPSIDKLRTLTRLLEIGLAELLGERATALNHFTERLERVLEILPTAQSAIIDPLKNAEPGELHNGLYVVRITKGQFERIVARVVWPKQT